MSERNSPANLADIHWLNKKPSLDPTTDTMSRIIEFSKLSTPKMSSRDYPHFVYLRDTSRGNS